MPVEFELPKLKYSWNALEPHIDAETVQTHYQVHYKGYAEKLAEALEGSGFEEGTAEELLTHYEEVPEDLQFQVQKFAGGVANHTLYFAHLSPNGGGSPKGALKKALPESWKEELEKACEEVWGSGWAWIVADGGELKILSTENQDSPLMLGLTPILGIDCWEHAYYLKHRADRAAYVKDFWKVIDWEAVEQNLDGIAGVDT
jgi:Fe-Mn family superoxide dismutase